MRPPVAICFRRSAPVPSLQRGEKQGGAPSLIDTHALADAVPPLPVAAAAAAAVRSCARRGRAQPGAVDATSAEPLAGKPATHTTLSGIPVGLQYLFRTQAAGRHAGSQVAAFARAAAAAKVASAAATPKLLSALALPGVKSALSGCGAAELASLSPQQLLDRIDDEVRARAHWLTQWLAHCLTPCLYRWP